MQAKTWADKALGERCGREWRCRKHRKIASVEFSLPVTMQYRGPKTALWTVCSEGWHMHVLLCKKHAGKYEIGTCIHNWLSSRQAPPIRRHKTFASFARTLPESDRYGRYSLLYCYAVPARMAHNPISKTYEYVYSSFSGSHRKRNCPKALEGLGRCNCFGNRTLVHRRIEGRAPLPWLRDQ